MKNQGYSYNYFTYFNINKNYILDKDKVLSDYVGYMLDRTNVMFRYENLPDTIPHRMLELYLQSNGNCFITKVNDKLYAFTGTKGGYPDEYYQPTTYIVSNPALDFFKELKIDEEGILFRNDSNEIGLLPLLNRYCSLFVENTISFRSSAINSRIATILSAGDDKTKKSAEQFINKIIDGELAVIGENPFLEGVKSHSVTPQGNSLITQLVEMQQYLQASLFNELGLDANYNMKKSNITSTEADLNNDFLLPLVDDMYNHRLEAVNKINEMYGTEITVDFDSTWKTNQMEDLKEREIYATPPDDEGEYINKADLKNDVIDGTNPLHEPPVKELEEELEEKQEVLNEETNNDDKQSEELEDEHNEGNTEEDNEENTDKEKEENSLEDEPDEETSEDEPDEEPSEDEETSEGDNKNAEVQEKQDKSMEDETGNDTDENEDEEDEKKGGNK